MQRWNQRKVLVTGATGLVGTRLVRMLLDHGANVTCFVRDDDPASPLHLSGDWSRVAVASGRLECWEHVKAAVAEREPDTIFHLGAQAIVGVGRRDPIGTFETNVRGTWHVLEACRLYGDTVKRIVVASSDKVYGECEKLPCDETAPLAAVNPYDVSKTCADQIAQSYAATYNLPVAIARCGNIFGPGDLNDSRLVPGTIRALLKGQRPIIRSDGTLVRDYLYVDDAAAAYLALAHWLDAPAHQQAAQRAFNFSDGRPMTVLQMVRAIARAVQREDLEPKIENTARSEIRAQHLDASRARCELHWSAQWPIDKALAETVRWYRRLPAHQTRLAPNPQAEAVR